MTTPQQNGLTAWRERQQLEREWKLARLEELRRDATEEVRDGQTFRVVRIPDRYEWGKPKRPVEVKFHRHSVQLMHDLTRGPNPLRGDLI